MKISLRIVVPTVAAGLLLAGCGGTSATTTTAATGAATSAAPASSEPATTTAPAASPSSSTASAGSGATKPPGSKVFVDKANGYQFALPKGYVRITSKAQLAKVYKAGASAVAKAGISQQLLNKALKTVAVQPGTGNSVNVVEAAAGGLTVDQLPVVKPLLKSQLSKIGAKQIAFKNSTLGGQPALRISYSVTKNGSKLSSVQYVTAHDDKAYTLTFSGVGGVPAKIEKQTAASWRFV